MTKNDVNVVAEENSESDDDYWMEIYYLLVVNTHTIKKRCTDCLPTQTVSTRRHRAKVATQLSTRTRRSFITMMMSWRRSRTRSWLRLSLVAHRSFSWNRRKWQNKDPSKPSPINQTNHKRVKQLIAFQNLSRRAKENNPLENHHKDHQVSIVCEMRNRRLWLMDHARVNPENASLTKVTARASDNRPSNTKMSKAQSSLTGI